MHLDISDTKPIHKYYNFHGLLYWFSSKHLTPDTDKPFPKTYLLRNLLIHKILPRTENLAL